MLMKMIPDAKQCLKMSLERNANFHILRPPTLLPDARIPSLYYVNNYRSQQPAFTYDCQALLQNKYSVKSLGI